MTTGTASTSETGAKDTGSSTGTGTATQDPAKPEVDWKAKSREWEKRAKANADAATRLAEIEESQKSETQKLIDAAAEADKAAATAKAEALRWRIAAKHQISDDDAELFLTGTDEDSLTKQAERLMERDSTRKNNNNVVSKEGTATKPTTSDMREFTRNLFAGD